MKKKVKKIKVLILGLLSIITFIFVLRMVKTPELEMRIIKESTHLSYDSKFNYRQSINDCGPFNVAAVTRILKDVEVDSKIFAKKIKWRLPNGYTLPWGLEKQLKENDIKTKTPYLGFLSDEEKISYLKQELSKGNPIVILGERNEYIGKNYEHYLTLVGFNSNEDVFYAYDPFFPASSPGMTQDDNGDLPGNRKYSTKELLNFWQNGGMFGVYQWYALVAEN